MNSRLFWALSLGAALIACAATEAGAQVKETEETAARPAAANSARRIPERATDSTHSYDAGALRFESSWGNVRIIRGADGPVLGTVGRFRDFDLTQLLASSPSAVAEVRVFQTDNFRGSLVGGVGAATTLVGVLVAANRSNNASSPVLVIGGVSAMVWGAQHLSMSYSALSRAMWWYNRDLTR
ncbi:MAG TPA: hypothetical protein VHE82_09180 [Gemmatimonadaceae bacterium]|nr:hypothetical protein [Gemmatimonadaceae bacterium]